MKKHLSNDNFLMSIVSDLKKLRKKVQKLADEIDHRMEKLQINSMEDDEYYSFADEDYLITSQTIDALDNLIKDIGEAKVGSLLSLNNTDYEHNKV